MKFSELLSLNCKENEENLEVLKRAVLKTKWFKDLNENDLDLVLVEKRLRKISKKYPGYIGLVTQSSEHSWLFVIRHLEDFNTIENIYCYTLLEGLLKTVLVFYAFFVLEKPLSYKKGKNK